MASTMGSTAVLIDRNGVGTAISVDYTGSVLGFPTSGLGALTNFVYTGASDDGRTYNFSYALTNDSSLTSRVRSFGFDVVGATPTGLASTGVYSTQIQNPLSALIGSDICFAMTGLGGCTGGSGGVSAGQSTSGTFALSFATMMSAVSLSDFVVNFQGVNGVFGGTGTGTSVAVTPGAQVIPATPVTPVSVTPEASSWAMMIIGFGAIGWLLRRRGAPNPWLPSERLHA